MTETQLKKTTSGELRLVRADARRKERSFALFSNSRGSELRDDITAEREL